MIGYCFKETKYSRNVKRVNFLLLKLVRYFLYLFTDHNITNPQVILSSSNYVECISVYASCNFIDSLGSIKWKHIQSVFYGGDFILFCNVEWYKVRLHQRTFIINQYLHILSHGFEVVKITDHSLILYICSSNLQQWIWFLHQIKTWALAMFIGHNKMKIINKTHIDANAIFCSQNI